MCNSISPMVERILRRLLPLFLLGLMVAPMSAAPAENLDQFGPVREKIRDLITYWKVPSIAVAVAYKGRVVWEEGFGFADPEQKVPATENTIYSLASISKPITATALMTLVQKGHVNLDAPINSYLDDAKLVARVGNVNQATVRRVANHSAGLMPHYKTFEVDRDERIPLLRDTINRFGSIAMPPGERFVYSNIGYGLLGRVIEKQSGQPFGLYLEKAVFEPLGLPDATVSATVNETPGIAKRYFFGSQKLPDYDGDTPPAGSVFMSAHDLLRFGLYHLNGEVSGQKRSVLTHASIAEMQKPLLLNDGSTNAVYGLGWQLGRKHGLDWFGHDGGMSGVSTVLTIYPGADLVVVVLSNGMTDNEQIYALQDDVVHILLPATVAEDGNFIPPASAVGNWQGTIEIETERVPIGLRILKDGSAFVRLGRGPEQVVLESKSQGAYMHFEGLRAFLDYSGISRRDGQIELTLTPRAGGRMTGYAQVNALFSFGDRWGSNLSYWTELAAMSEASPASSR